MMFKFSKYIICLPLENENNDWLLMNSCSGFFDVINESTARILLLAQENASEINNIEPEKAAYFKKAGCIIPCYADEEKTVSYICEKAHKKSSERLNVTFIPSYLCNFNCPYCFERTIKTEASDWLRAKMSRETVDCIFKNLNILLSEGKTVDSFTLFGGEPLLLQNKDIIEYILEKCQPHNAPVFVVTNGYYLDEFIEMFIKYRIHALKITVDGNREMHDKRRAPARGKSFDRIMKNVVEALENGIAVAMRTNINRENFSCIEDLTEYFRKHNFDKYENFSYYFKATMECFEPEGNEVTDIEIMEKTGNSCDCFCLNSAFSRVHHQLKRMFRTGVAAFKSEYCGAHSGNLVFDPMGKIYSCWDVLTDDRSVIGYVDTSKGSLEFNDNYAVWCNRTVDKIDFCKDCKYKLFCGGGCAAQSLVIKNELNQPFCEQFQERFNIVAVQTAREILLKQQVSV